jgi:hemerythrin
MALMTWNNGYSVGVRAIDSQHTTLFNLLNGLHEAMMKGQSENLTGPLLHKLVDYTRDHFSAEEAMLAAANYPGLAQHRIAHRDLARQVEGYVAKFEKGEGAINIKLLVFLRDWLTDHIQGTDKKYGQWLNQHGVH